MQRLCYSGMQSRDQREPQRPKQTFVGGTIGLHKAGTFHMPLQVTLPTISIHSLALIVPPQAGN